MILTVLYLDKGINCCYKIIAQSEEIKFSYEVLVISAIHLLNLN